MKSTPPFDENYKRFGMGDQNFIYQSGSYFIIQFGIVSYYVGGYVINHICKKFYWFRFARKIGIRVYQQSYYQQIKFGIMKLFMEAYFDLILCAFL